MKLFEQLVDASMDATTSMWSDDPSTIKRDNDKFDALFASQDRYSGELVHAVTSHIYNGNKSRIYICPFCETAYLEGVDEACEPCGTYKLLSYEIWLDTQN